MKTTEEVARDLNEALRPWRGATARLWNFTASLNLLEIRLERADQPGNAHLRCLSCVRLRAEVGWQPANLAVEVASNDMLRIVDNAANLIVECSHASVLLDVSPVH